MLLFMLGIISLQFISSVLLACGKACSAALADFKMSEGILADFECGTAGSNNQLCTGWTVNG